MHPLYVSNSKAIHPFRIGKVLNQLKVIDKDDITIFERLGLFRKAGEIKITFLYDPDVKKLRKGTVGRKYFDVISDLKLLGFDVIMQETANIPYGAMFYTKINDNVHIYGPATDDLSLVFLLAMHFAPWEIKTQKKYAIFAGIYCPSCPVESLRIMKRAKEEGAEVHIFESESAEEIAAMFGIVAYPTTFVGEELEPLAMEIIPEPTPRERDLLLKELDQLILGDGENVH